MKYAHYDQLSGEIKGFYDSKIHSEIPTPSVKLSDSDWLSAVSASGKKRVDPSSKSLIDYAPALSLEDLKGQKLKDIDLVCSSKIVGGFSSNALGASYRYSSDPIDQMNIAGNVQRASINDSDVKHNCYDESGIRRRMSHTKAQMIQVGTDLANHVDAHLDKAFELKQKVEVAFTAKDEKALQAITW